MSLFAVMRDARTALAEDESQWDTLIRVCRRGNLLGRLGHELQRRSLLDEVPPGPRRHLQSALARARRQAVAVRLEIEALRHALAGVDTRLVLLKGAAYLANEQAASHGRLFSDIDILVPHERLDAAESALMQAGWHMMPIEGYDERYYRQWMHELPPMQHRTRGTVLDVHHTLLPRTAKIQVSGQALLAAARPAALPGVWVLSDIDQILHSACHWFFESEYHNGLRDCLDVVSLVDATCTGPAQWRALTERARMLGLSQPLGRVLAVCADALGLEVPGEVRADLGREMHRGPLMRWLGDCALAPEHPLTNPRLARVGRVALLSRGHWLRMPLTMLIPHLARKALGR